MCQENEIQAKISRGEVSPSLQPGPKLPVLRYPLDVEVASGAGMKLLFL
jgi:hypothetical protein